jgi:hypothetical protein
MTFPEGSLQLRLNAMEHEWFFKRTTGVASGNGYIASNTWRAYRATPKEEDAPSRALKRAFVPLADRFDLFVREPGPLVRDRFDRFHEREMEWLFEFLQTSDRRCTVQPAAAGEFHGYAYNSVAKVLDLAYSHWCFRRPPDSNRCKYDPTMHPEIRLCLHVPLDTQVLSGINEMVKNGMLTREMSVPRGGMGAVRSIEEYRRIQEDLRSVVDRFESTNFASCKVAPIAFDGFWAPGK